MSNEMVCYLPHEYSQISWYFLAHGGKICIKVIGRRRHSKQLCGGTAIPRQVGGVQLFERSEN